MLGERAHFGPVLTAVVGAEQRAGIDAAPQRVGTRGAIWLNTPDAVQVDAAVFVEGDTGRGFFPRFAAVGRDLHVVAPPTGVDGGPQAAVARVAVEVVDLPALVEGSCELPIFAFRIGRENESALTRADVQMNLGLSALHG